MIVTQLRIAPLIIPLPIIGMVMVKKVFILLAPREMAASSMVSGICCSTATEERIVYGIRRMISARTMIVAVPVSMSGRLLKLRTRAIPTTEPGIMYGTIESVSMILLAKLTLLTTR